MFLLGILRPLNRALATVVGFGILATASVASATPTFADDSSTSSFQISWTTNGIYPHSEPTLSSSKRSGPAVPNGTRITIECEIKGEAVRGPHGVSDIWEKTTDGHYFPNAYVYTGVDGWTPGVKRCVDSRHTSGNSFTQHEVAESIDNAVWVRNDGKVWKKLLAHYYKNTGEDVSIDWSFFLENPRLMRFALSLDDDNTEVSYKSSIKLDGFDTFASLGTFSIRRTSKSCFFIRDYYDFSAVSPYLPLKTDADLDVASEFNIYSSGCVIDEYTAESLLNDNGELIK